MLTSTVPGASDGTIETNSSVNSSQFLVIVLVLFSFYDFLYWLFWEQALTGTLLFPVAFLASLALTLGTAIAFVIFNFVHKAPFVHPTGESKHKLWVTLHTLLIFFSLVDLVTVVSILLIAYYVFVGFSVSPAYGYFLLIAFCLGMMSFTGVLFKTYVLNFLGQDYKGPGIMSMTGAAALGFIAQQLFEREDRKGVRYLLYSLGLAQSAFRRGGFTLKTITAGSLAVEYMQVVDFPKLLPNLKATAEGLSNLPGLSGLENSLLELMGTAKLSLETMEILRGESQSQSQFWVIFAAVVGAIGTIFAILPEASRGLILTAMASNSGNAILVVGGIGVWYVTYKLFRQVFTFPIFRISFARSESHPRNTE
jgi:hypothetical protein